MSEPQLRTPRPLSDKEALALIHADQPDENAKNGWPLVFTLGLVSWFCLVVMWVRL